MNEGRRGGLVIGTNTVLYVNGKPMGFVTGVSVTTEPSLKEVRIIREPVGIMLPGVATGRVRHVRVFWFELWLALRERRLAETYGDGRRPRREHRTMGVLRRMWKKGEMP